MGTISSAFSIITGALDADQSALNATSNNVANANTPGYTREKPIWQENSPVTIGGISNGQGVSQTGTLSIRDKVLTARIDQQQQLASSSAARLAALNTVQSLFIPDSGTSSAKAGDVGNDITSFFNSFSALEANPNSSSLRLQVLTTAGTLASDISGAAKSLISQKSALDQEAAGVTSQINALTSSIAKLNQQIMSTSPSGDAGTLEDRRQQAISELSKLVGVNQITSENNGLSITTTSGALLVSADKSYEMTNGTVNGVTNFFVGTANITAGLETGGGELGGYLTARDSDIPSVLGSLNQLAYSISTSVNSQNNMGTDADGNTGAAIDSSTVGAWTLDLFSPPPTLVANTSSGDNDMSGAAASMRVVMNDPNQIAAAASESGTGDNSNAIKIAALAASADANVDNETPSDFYASFVSALGSTVSEVKTEYTAQTASVTQLQTQCDSLSGVNLDEEASSLMTLERSYQAASKVMSILNTLMASALNLGQATTVG
jgi:flagellar hook-associated protein 1